MAKPSSNHKDLDPKPPHTDNYVDVLFGGLLKGAADALRGKKVDPMDKVEEAQRGKKKK